MAQCKENVLIMKWNKFSDIQPPCGVRVLVVKQYLDAEYNEYGYHSDKSFWTKPIITIDVCWANGHWHNGGKETHWMPLPELPED